MSRQVPQTVSFINNGISFDVNKVQTAFSNQGVSAPPKCRMDIIPAATTANFICPANAFNAAGQPLAAANQVTFLSQLVVQLDCDRCPAVTFSAVSTAATTVTITGYDYRNVKVTATSPNLPVGTAGWNCPKAMSKILSVVLTASPGAGITTQVGNGQAIGLPYFINSVQQITSLSFNGLTVDPNTALDAIANNNVPTSVADPAGNVVGLGNPWRVGATQAPAVAPTSLTADARGIVAILAPVPAPAFDGVKMISIEFYVYGADSFVQCQLMNNVVSAQTMVGGIIGVAGTPIPTLVYADEVGWQFPGDGGYNG